MCIFTTHMPAMADLICFKSRQFISPPDRGWETSCSKMLNFLELWRINKLDDISVISGLVHLETIKLQDLRHIHELPDLSGLQKLKKIVLINVPVNEDEIPDELKPLIKHW